MMKKILIMTIAVIITSIASTSANTFQVVANPSAKSADEIKLKLDLGDITNMSKKEIESKVNKFIEKFVPKNAELECSVKVTGTVMILGSGVSVEVTVTGPCSEVAKKGKAIAKSILEDLKEAFQ